MQGNSPVGIHTHGNHRAEAGAANPRRKVLFMSIYDDVAALQQSMTEAQAAITALNTAVGAMGVTELIEGIDLHELAEGDYLIPNAAVSATILNKPTTSTHTARVRVLSMGDSGQKSIYYIPCSKTNNCYYVQAYYSGGWGDWITTALTDSGWLDLPLSTGITAYSDTQKPRYRKIGNEIFLSGVYKGAEGENVTIATLPSGYRPTNKVIVACASVGQMFSKVSIETNGEIILNRTTIEPVAAVNWHSIACSFAI